MWQTVPKGANCLLCSLNIDDCAAQNKMGWISSMFEWLRPLAQIVGTNRRTIIETRFVAVEPKPSGNLVQRRHRCRRDGEAVAVTADNLWEAIQCGTLVLIIDECRDHQMRPFDANSFPFHIYLTVGSNHSPDYRLIKIKRILYNNWLLFEKWSSSLRLTVDTTGGMAFQWLPLTVEWLDLHFY